MKTILIEPIPVQIVVNHGALTITDETNRLLYFHVYDSNKRLKQESPTTEEISEQLAYAKQFLSNI